MREDNKQGQVNFESVCELSPRNTISSCMHAPVVRKTILAQDARKALALEAYYMLLSSPVAFADTGLTPHDVP